MKKNSQLTERIKAVIASKPSSFKEMEHLKYLLGYSSVTTLYARLESSKWSNAEVFYLEKYYLEFLQKEEGGGAGATEYKSELKKIKVSSRL